MGALSLGCGQVAVPGFSLPVSFRNICRQVSVWGGYALGVGRKLSTSAPVYRHVSRSHLVESSSLFTVAQYSILCHLRLFRMDFSSFILLQGLVISTTNRDSVKTIEGHENNPFCFRKK
jgi:hypothetical protein